MLSEKDQIDLEKRLKIWQERHRLGAHCVASLKDVEWLVEILKQGQLPPEIKEQ